MYFIEDSKQIYKGDVDVTSSVAIVTSFADAPTANEVEGKFYINATTLEVRIKNGDAWVILSPGYINNLADFKASGNGGKFATITAIKDFVDEQIGGGTAFVRDIEFDDESGELKLDKGAATTTDVELTGVAHTPTYADLTITIPVYGQDDVVINLPKDNFVRSGRYEAEYDLPDGTKGPAIVLVVNDGTQGEDKEVVIPAASLVDIYTGGNTNNIHVSVADDKTITADVVIDPAVGNALSTSAAGLMVDVSDKANKLTGSTENDILVADADGDIKDSGFSVKSTGTLASTDTTAVPVASLVVSAINTAIGTVNDTIATITNDDHTGRLDVLEDTVDSIDETILGEGNADEVIISTDAGIVRSGKSIGGATLAATPNEDTLATEAAVADAISWKTL